MEMRPLAALLDFLRGQPKVWVRLAASRRDDAWILAVLEVTAGEAPPGWYRECWRYEHAIFIGSRLAGATIARWLDRGRVSLSSLSVPVAVEDSVSVERRDSGFQGIYESLPWPTREWRMRSTASGQTMHEELVAADAPAFIGFDQAASAFFGVPSRPNRNFSGSEIVVRHQDRRARIGRVRVHPSLIVADVSGEQLHGTSLALSGPQGARRKLSSRTREVRLPLPGGLGSGAWLALHRDLELLDRRMLDRTWNTDDEEVEFVVESSTGVEVLVSRGEGARVEFKRELPARGMPGFLKTVAAFANGGGGTILFGVADDGEIVGVGDDRMPNEQDRLTSLISDWVRPLPHYEIEWVDASRRGVIVLNVSAGDEVPYGVGTDDRAVRFYIRRGANTFPASPADVRALVVSRIPAEAPTPMFPRRRP